MPEPAASPARPWPAPLAIALLAIFVLADATFWFVGLYHLGQEVSNEHLAEAGKYLTLALVVMLLGGWAWRWAVAAGKIGGRPTPRFGGTG